jgi:hypothetical protein
LTPPEHRIGPREDENTVGLSADGQAPDPQRVVADDHDAAESEVLVDRREVGKQQAGELLDPAAVTRRTSTTDGPGSWDAASSVPKSVSALTSIRPSSRAVWRTTRSLAARSLSEPTWTASQPSLARTSTSRGDRLLSSSSLTPTGATADDAP